MEFLFQWETELIAMEVWKIHQAPKPLPETLNVYGLGFRQGAFKNTVTIIQAPTLLNSLSEDPGRHLTCHQTMCTAQ